MYNSNKLSDIDFINAKHYDLYPGRDSTLRKNHPVSRY